MLALDFNFGLIVPFDILRRKVGDAHGSVKGGSHSI